MTANCQKCSVPLLNSNGVFYSTDEQHVCCSLSCCSSLNRDYQIKNCPKHHLIKTKNQGIFAETMYSQCLNCNQYFNKMEYKRYSKWLFLLQKNNYIGYFVNNRWNSFPENISSLDWFRKKWLTIFDINDILYRISIEIYWGDLLSYYSLLLRYLTLSKQ